MLNLELGLGGFERAEALARQFPEELFKALYAANKDSVATVLRTLKLKLSNDVLRVRTGTLRRNWVQVFPQKLEDGSGYYGKLASGKTEYAAVHEFGFSGTVSVRSHPRRNPRRRTGTTKGGKARYTKWGGGTHTVGAYSRAMRIPARPYARPSLEENINRIVAIHEDTVRQAWERAGRPT